MTKHIETNRGRPLVAVTGMGVVTSLGVGKADNWAALTQGRSGIKRISRFPTEGLRTTIAGTVDLLDEQSQSAPARSIAMALCAAEEAIAEAAHRIGARFPRSALPGHRRPPSLSGRSAKLFMTPRRLEGQLDTSA